MVICILVDQALMINQRKKTTDTMRSLFFPFHLLLYFSFLRLFLLLMMIAQREKKQQMIGCQIHLTRSHHCFSSFSVKHKIRISHAFILNNNVNHAVTDRDVREE
jgi:hypothetical protein